MQINGESLKKYGMSEADIGFTMHSFVPERIESGSYFLKQGNISDKIAFVKSGLLRSFFMNDEAEEITTQFFPSASLVISFESFNNQVSSRENIIALEDSELFVITFSGMQELYKRIPLWQQVCKDIADLKSQEMIARSLEFQTLTATQRYQKFCSEYPEVIRRAPLKHIATFLGIDIATLSRIRKKK